MVLGQPSYPSGLRMKVTWVLHKMGITEMRMLRWMCGRIRKDKIRNERFQEHLGIASISDKIRETRLRWFRHVQCKLATAPVRKSFTMQADAHQGEGVGQRGCGWK